MFNYINKQGVKSDKGFVVQRTGRFTAEYQEKIGKITIELENEILPNGKFAEIISYDAFKKWDGGVLISEEKK